MYSYWFEPTLLLSFRCVEVCYTLYNEIFWAAKRRCGNAGVSKRHLPWWLPETCNALGNPKRAQRMSSQPSTERAGVSWRQLKNATKDKVSIKASLPLYWYVFGFFTCFFHWKIRVVCSIGSLPVFMWDVGNSLLRWIRQKELFWSNARKHLLLVDKSR